MRRIPARRSPTGRAARKRILIGSQRDPAAYRVRPRHDWAPLDESDEKPAEEDKPSGKRRGRHRHGDRQEGRHFGPSPTGHNRHPDEVAPAGTENRAEGTTPVESGNRRELTAPGAVPVPTSPVERRPTFASQTAAAQAAAGAPPSELKSAVRAVSSDMIAELAATLTGPPTAVPRPSVRDKSSHEMEDELRQAMGGASMDDLLGGGQSEDAPLELDSVQGGQVIAIRRDDVFVELAGRQQGVVSLRQFDVPPPVGTTVQVVVQRQNPDDGLYELTLPNRAVQVDDWSDLVEGALVEVHVTGHNTGGLECEVNHIRGFIPVSQISLWRVEEPGAVCRSAADLRHFRIGPRAAKPGL